jgi:hypothetical protein
MKLFVDEQKAFDKMKADGMSDEQAQNLIKQRRDDLMGGNTKLNPLQSAALVQMQKSGVTSDEAVKRVIQQGETPKDDRPAWKKAGEQATNFALGNLATVSKYGGNTLDFLTAGKAGFGEMVKEGDQAIKQDVKDSTAFKVGEYLPGVAASVAPIGGAAAGANAVRQGATIGGFFGMANPIIQKGNEATATEVLGGGAIGGVTGGFA